MPPKQKQLTATAKAAIKAAKAAAAARNHVQRTRLSRDLRIAMMLMHKVQFPEVKQLGLHITNAPRLNGGLRHFREGLLPSIKFHNPAMEVAIHTVREATPASLSVTFRDGQVVKVDPAGKDSPFIWDELVAVARGVASLPSTQPEAPPVLGEVVYQDK